MKKRALSNPWITIGAILLIIFGSLMIFSAELGNSHDEGFSMQTIIIRQTVFIIAGIVLYIFLSRVRVLLFNERMVLIGYIVIMVLLLMTRAFGSINGAYAWIPLGSFGTIQPAEFAKFYMILLAGKYFGYDHEEVNNKYMIFYLSLVAIYTFIILIYQHDLGSAVVLFAICFSMALIPSYKEIKKIQKFLYGLALVGVVGVAFLLSPQVTEWMKLHSDNYMIGRFLAAADPFMFQYDRGYHVVMSLVSFANGGWFGLGYSNSIHKYMNFPNQSNDFILPIIVEELGFVGFIGMMVLYMMVLLPIIIEAIKTKNMSTKVICMGTVVYFLAHFILNTGGVSGLIPLTGVPLLMISSGGSSLCAAMMSLGLVQNEIRNEKIEV